ncbi:hypothetical protein ACVXG8_14370 [Escherichia coli]
MLRNLGVGIGYALIRINPPERREQTGSKP